MEGGGSKGDSERREGEVCVRMCVCVWCPDLRGERERQKHIRLEGNEKDERERERASEPRRKARDTGDN